MSDKAEGFSVMESFVLVMSIAAIVFFVLVTSVNIHSATQRIEKLEAKVFGKP